MNRHMVDLPGGGLMTAISIGIVLGIHYSTSLARI